MKQCIDCDRFVPEKELSRKGRCFDCAAKIVGEVAYQMGYREGKYYERWLLAKARMITNYEKAQEKALAHYKEALDNMERQATPEGQLEDILFFGGISPIVGDK